MARICRQPLAAELLREVSSKKLEASVLQLQEMNS